MRHGVFYGNKSSAVASTSLLEDSG